MARGLAENGASKVYIMGRRESKLKEAAALHPRHVCSAVHSRKDKVKYWIPILTAIFPSSLIPLVGDVTSKESLQAAAEQVKNETGHVNLLVANAGMSGPMLDKLRARHSLAEFVDYAWKTPMDEFSQVYNMNCSATFYTILGESPPSAQSIYLTGLLYNSISQSPRRRQQTR